MPILSFKDLEVWQRAMDLAQEAYGLTKSFPKGELYGMTSQIRRAAASIPANIAEGWARESTAEFMQYIRIAKGSLRELETHLILCQRVELASAEKLRPLLDNIGILSRQLLALQRSLKARL